MTRPTTDADVARWMVDELARKKELFQEEAAWEIQRQFGKSYLYSNANGNPAIAKTVLKAFNKLTPGNVVWSRSERFWRFRSPTDRPGRMQY